MIQIDGSQGEGGGQILRSALTLSLMTGQPMHITMIRARRSRPGLQAQHLAAVQAAAAVGGAHVEGARLGFDSLIFQPGTVQPGRYQFDIGTAGATSLVLQTIFLPLSRVGTASSVTLTGGTHVPLSPSFHYLELQWLPCMRRIGYDGRLTLERVGFYPQGGGRLHVAIRPAGNLTPLRLIRRGSLQRLYGISAVANLEVAIAERQREQAMRRVRTLHPRAHVDVVQLPATSKGSALLLLAEFEGGRCCYQSLSERHKPAESVAGDAVQGLEGFLKSDGTVDEYLADQILLPLAFASGTSEFRTARVTQHLLTNAAIIRLFLPTTIEIDGELDQSGLVRVIPQE